MNIIQLEFDFGTDSDTEILQLEFEFINKD
jgi:hypothetical protein